MVLHTHKMCSDMLQKENEFGCEGKQRKHNINGKKTGDIKRNL